MPNVNNAICKSPYRLRLFFRLFITVVKVNQKRKEADKNQSERGAQMLLILMTANRVWYVVKIVSHPIIFFYTCYIYHRIHRDIEGREKKLKKEKKKKKIG